jgi:sugar lactone lactonase YvrE
LYIADSSNHRIRKVNAEGVITTIAGDGTTIQAGYGMEGPIITGTYGGDGGQAVAAQLNSPSGVVIDQRGYLFIADTDNHRVRQVDSAGMITTIAGTGSEETFIYPIALAADSQNRLYITLLTEHQIYQFDTSGQLTLIAGNGVEGYNGDGKTGLETAFQHPQGLALDSMGHLYVADSSNHRIRKLTTSQPIDNSDDPDNPDTPPGPEVPPSGGNAIGMNTKGERLTSTANFNASVSLNGTDFAPLVTAEPGQTITFKAEITVDPEHRLLESDILLVYGAEPPPAPYTGNEDTVYKTIDSDGQESVVDLYAAVEVWMAQFDKPYTPAVILRDTVTVKTWKKSFDTPSMYYLFVGYRLPNGTIIYVSKPIMVNVSEP